MFNYENAIIRRYLAYKIWPANVMPNNSMTNYNNYHLILFSSSTDSAFDH